MAQIFAPVAQALEANADKIAEELLSVQGTEADLGGYYRPDASKAASVMRPSATLNSIIDPLRKA